ncbi:MAG TPA: TonB-dependent receptor [Candidatus Kapabacteria bacterium]|nr:TonB-dependent receptor [Candidatus Kapabacteria bacterium]
MFARILWASAFFILIFFCRPLAAQQSQTTLRLPPSLERELKLRGANHIHIVRFSDTVKADKLISQSIRDSSGRRELDSTMVHDSAIVIVDSAVSLSDKQWLDSMLAELPETERTSEGLRFHYPDKMMVNTSRRQVPFDSTITKNMDPVSKEDLPIFDEMPMPKPLMQTMPPKYDISLAVGSPYLPSIMASAMLVNDPHRSIDAGASYIRRASDATAIGDEWRVRANGIFTFEPENISPNDPKPMIGIAISIGSLSRLIKTDSTSSDFALTRDRLDGSFALGSLDAIRATGSAALHYFNDNAGISLSERSGGLRALFEHEVSDNTNRLSLDLGYTGASESPIAMKNFGALGAFTAEALMSSATNASFNWKVGITFINTADASGNISYLFPKFRIGKQFSTDFSMFAELSRSAHLESFDALSGENPFYAPMLPVADSTVRSVAMQDSRRIGVDKYNFTAGADYFLSTEDHLHFAINFGERNNDVAFYSLRDSNNIIRYFPTALNTLRFGVDVDGSILLLKKDLFSFTTHFASTQSKTDSKQLPYVPIFIGDGTYDFRSVSERFFPSLGVKVISRSEMNSLFVNASAKYVLSAGWDIKITLLNIFGSDGAYWSPYNEYPRYAGIGIEGRF